MNITITDLKQEFTHDGKTYTIVEKAQLERLLALLQENKADIHELKNVVVSILRLLGIWDDKTNSIKESIKTGEEGYFGNILKGLGDVISLLTRAQVPIIGKKAEAELMQKFAFLKTLVPIIEKHAHGK